LIEFQSCWFSHRHRVSQHRKTNSTIGAAATG
jgi:hypothetical protein